MTKTIEELKEKSTKAVIIPALVEFAKTAPLNSDGRVNLSWVYEQAFEYVCEETKDLQKARELAISTRWLAMLRRDHEEEFQALISGELTSQKKPKIVEMPERSGMGNDLLSQWIDYWEWSAIYDPSGNRRDSVTGDYARVRALRELDIDPERIEKILGTQVRLSSGGTHQLSIAFSVAEGRTRVEIWLPNLCGSEVKGQGISINLLSFSQIIYEEETSEVGFGFRMEGEHEDHNLHFVRIAKDGNVSVDWRTVRR